MNYNVHYLLGRLDYDYDDALEEMVYGCLQLFTLGKQRHTFL